MLIDEKPGLIKLSILVLVLCDFQCSRNNHFATVRGPLFHSALCVEEKLKKWLLFFNPLKSNFIQQSFAEPSAIQLPNLFQARNLDHKVFEEFFSIKKENPFTFRPYILLVLLWVFSQFV